MPPRSHHQQPMAYPVKTCQTRHLVAKVGDRKYTRGVSTDTPEQTRHDMPGLVNRVG